MSGKASWPFGPADAQSKSYGAAIAATIVDSGKTILTLAQMTGAATLNLTIDGSVKAGAALLIKVSADGTNRALTPGTGMTGVAQTIVASKNFLLAYEYDGSTFLHRSTVQLD